MTEHTNEKSLIKSKPETAVIVIDICPDAEEGAVQRGEEKPQLTTALNSPVFYASNDAGKIGTASDRLSCLDTEPDCAYRRWNELEYLVAKLGG